MRAFYGDLWGLQCSLSRVSTENLSADGYMRYAVQQKNELGLVVSPEDMEFAFHGRYRIEAHTSWAELEASKNARTNLQFELHVNGKPEGTLFQNNYLRDATGHKESGQHVSLELDLFAGQIISLFHKRISGPNNGKLTPVGNSYLRASLVRWI